MIKYRKNTDISVVTDTIYGRYIEKRIFKVPIRYRYRYIDIGDIFTEYAEFTEGHQYRRTDGLVGTGLMPYKAHSPKYQRFTLHYIF